MSDEQMIPLPGGWSMEPDGTAYPWWDISAPDGRSTAQMVEKDARAFALAMNTPALAAVSPAVPEGLGEENARLRAALQTAIDAIHLYLQPSAMDGGIGECAAVVNARHAVGEARAALASSPSRQEGPQSGSGVTARWHVRYSTGSDGFSGGTDGRSFDTYADAAKFYDRSPSAYKRLIVHVNEDHWLDVSDATSFWMAPEDAAALQPPAPVAPAAGVDIAEVERLKGEVERLTKRLSFETRAKEAAYACEKRLRDHIRSLTGDREEA